MSKSLILAASLAMTACTQAPVITEPYKVGAIDHKNNVAEVFAGDLLLEVEFTPEYFNDGNGVGYSGRDMEIKQVNEIKIIDEDENEVTDYVLSSEEVSIIVFEIEKEIKENLK